MALFWVVLIFLSVGFLWMFHLKDLLEMIVEVKNVLDVVLN